MTDKLITDVIQWAVDKGITKENGVTPLTQWGKMKEEVYELFDELSILDKAEPMSSEDADELCNNIDLELGDVVVTAIVLAYIHGTDIRTCLSKAYAKIASRTGKVIDGTFIKD